MKILGVLGGMGPQATIRFYDLLIRTSIQKYNLRKNADFPHIFLDNIPVPDLIENKRDEEKTVTFVEEEATRLQKVGCTHLAMPCNTMHLYADRFQKASGLSFISMIDAVVERILKDRVSKVVLLGSVTTMDSTLYSGPLQKRGVECVIPSQEEKVIIGALIQSVIAGDIQESQIQTFAELVDDAAHKADAILLGCTELPILAQHFNVRVPIYDSALILAERCCRVLLDEEYIAS